MQTHQQKNQQKPQAQAPKTDAPKTTETPKETKAPDPVLGKKVKVLAEKNPKREGSKAHARFALYKKDMTVEAYIEACVAAGQDRRNARGDIKYDTEHKFIELVN